MACLPAGMGRSSRQAHTFLSFFLALGLVTVQGGACACHCVLYLFNSTTSLWCLHAAQCVVFRRAGAIASLTLLGFLKAGWRTVWR